MKHLCSYWIKQTNDSDVGVRFFKSASNTCKHGGLDRCPRSLSGRSVWVRNSEIPLLGSMCWIGTEESQSMGVCMCCVCFDVGDCSLIWWQWQSESVWLALFQTHCLTAGIYSCKVIGLHGAVTETLSYTWICVCSSNETDICGSTTN